MDHLACFAGGMYGMAAHNEKDSNSDRWMKIAEALILYIFQCKKLMIRLLKLL